MERRAEINRFAIFLFCLLVPLGSLAPTETSESKLTTAERQKSFIDELPYASSAIKKEAHDLFEFYHGCVYPTFSSEHEKIRSKARDKAEKIFVCPAFHANCCVLHDIHTILKTVGSHIKTICKENPQNVIRANLEQLDTTLSHGTAFYTCKGQDPPQIQAMSLPEKKTYIWWFLKGYQNITQTAAKLYSG